jgi:uncharacterized protein with GYD domain
MPRYVVTATWTDQGVRDATATLERARQVRQMLSELGAAMEQIYWTLGRYDVVTIMTAPDDETIAAGVLKISMSGGVRTEILRAFDESEMEGVLAKIG